MMDEATKARIAALWSVRNTDALSRKLLRASIRSEQKWRKMFRKLKP